MFAIIYSNITKSDNLCMSDRLFFIKKSSTRNDRRLVSLGKTPIRSKISKQNVTNSFRKHFILIIWYNIYSYHILYSRDNWDFFTM